MSIRAGQFERLEVRRIRVLPPLREQTWCLHSSLLSLYLSTTLPAKTWCLIHLFEIHCYQPPPPSVARMSRKTPSKSSSICSQGSSRGCHLIIGGMELTNTPESFSPVSPASPTASFRDPGRNSVGPGSRELPRSRLSSGYSPAPAPAPPSRSGSGSTRDAHAASAPNASHNSTTTTHSITNSNAKPGGTTNSAPAAQQEASPHPRPRPRLHHQHPARAGSVSDAGFGPAVASFVRVLPPPQAAAGGLKNVNVNVMGRIGEVALQEGREARVGEGEGEGRR
jgi:hypothetical protein